MKYCFYLLCCGALAFAQSSTSSSTLYTVDLNGRVVPEAQYVARDGDRTQLDQSINGRQVPLQSTETHVLTDQPNHRVIETIVRKYDANGQLAGTERTVADERKTAGGSTIQATVYRSDVNGRMQESERRVVDTQVSGKTTTADVTISRPGLSGGFATAEKRQVVTTKQDDKTHETETIERPSVNSGTFTEVARVVRDESQTPGKTTSSTALYEPDYQGNLALSRQDVTTTTQTGPGTQVTQLDTYAPSVYGIAREPQGSPKLREQETIVRSETDGVVTETTTVQRPTISDPNRLGEPTPVSTLVCKGACQGPLQPPSVTNPY